MMGAYMYAWMDPRKKFHKKSISSFIVSLKHVWTNLLGMREITISCYIAHVSGAQQPLTLETENPREPMAMPTCQARGGASMLEYFSTRVLNLVLEYRGNTIF